jgi:uncharacterized protein (DUF2141 family)
MRSIGIALALAGAVFLSAAGAAEAQEVRVTLTGVQARGGSILASLQSEAEFMQSRAAFGEMVAATEGSITIVFRNVPPGEYALSAMHDENGDNQMQRHPDGMPMEGWALSNSAMLMGPPTFAVNKFTVGAAPVQITEAIHYPPRPAR